MLATNASGSRAIQHGYTRDHVLGLRIMLDNGDCANVGREPFPLHDDAPGHLHDTLGALGVTLEHHRDLLMNHQRRLRFDRLGYMLDGVLSNDSLDVPRLLVGSEGTLCLFTEAKLKTIPVAGATSTIVLGFANLDKALAALPKILACRPSACELMDRRFLSLIRGTDAVDFAHLLSPAAEHVLLIEFERDGPDEARRVAETLRQGLTRGEHLALFGEVGLSDAEQRRMWRLREVAMPGLFGLRGGAQPVVGIEDIAVPIDMLGEFLRRVQEVFRQHDVTASFLVHAGAGQVHTRPFLDLRNPADVSRFTEIASQVHEMVLTMGGTVSSQHGTGLARTAWVARQAGPLYAIYRQVKTIFDPRNIFNPGKIVDPDPQLPNWPLRKFAQAEPVVRHLRWQPLEVIDETNQCNGCGHCRTETPDQRMCPIFRATGNEMMAPRSQANLVRALLRPNGDANPLASQAAREYAEHCVNCKMCLSECPAHVNVPKLMLEIKAVNVSTHGLHREDWPLVHMERLARLGASVPLVANAMLRSRIMRWMMGRVFGLSSRRKLPLFTRRPFMKLAQRRGWTSLPSRSSPRVALHVDLYANYFDPQIAEAAALVLQHHGYGVYVPPDQCSSGIEAIASGDIEVARDLARRNLRVFADLAREGIPIVCTEPSTALTLRRDYLDLLDDLDARHVADRTVEFTAFLGELRRQGKFRTDFLPLELALGHHVPCHHKALYPHASGPELLQLIPGIRVETIDKSCSGMAGTFGLKARNVELSRLAGAPMLQQMRSSSIAFGSTECSACRMQIEDAAGRRTLHPAQYLALAYGLLPKVVRRLSEPIRELVLR